MKYTEAIKIIDITAPNDIDVFYLFRLLETFDSMRDWAKDLDCKSESEKLVQSGIEFLEFAGIQNLISDWDKIKVKK